MPPSASFTGQNVLDAARKRHPALATTTIVDADVLPDLNGYLEDLLAKAVADPTRARGLTRRLANIAVVGADGSVIDLNPPEGDILRLIDLDATTAGVVRRAVLREPRQRDSMAGEFYDDPRPVGYAEFNGVNNRFDLIEVTNWTGVTAIRPYAVLKVAAITAGTVNAQVLLPSAFKESLIEKVALLIGSGRANLNAEWVKAREDALAAAEQALMANLSTPFPTEMLESGA